MPVNYPDSKVHGANMRPTWVLSASGGTHEGVMNLAIWVTLNDVGKLISAKQSQITKSAAVRTILRYTIWDSGSLLYMM